MSFLRRVFIDQVIQFGKKFWILGKGSFNDKAKIVDRGSLSSAPESTGSKLQYEPHLFSVVRS